MKRWSSSHYLLPSPSLSRYRLPPLLQLKFSFPWLSTPLILSIFSIPFYFLLAPRFSLLCSERLKANEAYHAYRNRPHSPHDTCHAIWCNVASSVIQYFPLLLSSLLFPISISPIFSPGINEWMKGFPGQIQNSEMEYRIEMPFTECSEPLKIGWRSNFV